MLNHLRKHLGQLLKLAGDDGAVAFFCLTGAGLGHGLVGYNDGGVGNGDRHGVGDVDAIVGQQRGADLRRGGAPRCTPGGIPLLAGDASRGAMGWSCHPRGAAVTLTNPDRSAMGVVVTRRRGSGRRWWASTELAATSLGKPSNAAGDRGVVACAVESRRSCAGMTRVRWSKCHRFRGAAACIARLKAKSLRGVRGRRRVAGFPSFGSQQRSRFRPQRLQCSPQALQLNLLGGELAILGNVAGMIGVGFLAASVLEGYLSWFGPSPTWPWPRKRSVPAGSCPGRGRRGRPKMTVP